MLTCSGIDIRHRLGVDVKQDIAHRYLLVLVWDALSHTERPAQLISIDFQQWPMPINEKLIGSNCSVKDIEDVATLLLAVTFITTEFVVAISAVITLWWAHRVSRWRGRLSTLTATILDQLFQFAAVKPHAPTSRTHVKLDAAAVDGCH
jgi:hypothetical protein